MKKRIARLSGLVFLALSTICLANPIRISLDPTGIEYHTESKPNALICQYVGEVALYTLTTVSETIWANPKSASILNFNNFTLMQAGYQNALICEIKGKYFPGAMNDFVCTPVYPGDSINVSEGLSSGKCYAHYR